MEKSPVTSAVKPYPFASTSSVAQVMYQQLMNTMSLYRKEKDWKWVKIDKTNHLSK